MMSHLKNSKAKTAFLFALLMAAVVPLSACDRNEGGMEEMGENMDEAATDFGNAVEDKCEEYKQEAGAENTNC